jgi:hypothetical protein
MAVAGWYVDPDAADRLRWWDGQAWDTWVSAQGRTWAEPLRGQQPSVTTAVSTPSALGSQPELQAPSYPTAPPSYPQAPSYPTPPPQGYVWGAGGVASGERFRSLKGLSVALLVMFIVTAVCYAAVSLTLVGRADTFSRADSGFVPADEITSADDGVAGAYLLSSICEIALFVLLIVWLWRAYSNTRVLGAGPWRWGRGWTVGAWFIPLANLVIPKLLINDAWRGADSKAPGNPLWRRLPVAGVVTVWWVLLAAGRVLLQVADAGATVVDDMGDVVPFDRFGAFVAVLCMAGCILGAVATWKMFRRQHARAAELGLA